MTEINFSIPTTESIKENNKILLRELEKCFNILTEGIEKELKKINSCFKKIDSRLKKLEKKK